MPDSPSLSPSASASPSSSLSPSASMSPSPSPEATDASQLVVEYLSGAPQATRATQQVIEYLDGVAQINRATQFLVEYIGGIAQVTRSTQIILEYLTRYVPPPPTPEITEAGTPVLATIPKLLIKRQREATLISTENQWLFHHQFVLDLETGVGATTGQGRDPTIILEWSNNSGHTWSHEHRLSAGRQGVYRWRAIWRRLGRSRNRVYRVTVSDPVKWALIDGYLLVDKGTA